MTRSTFSLEIFGDRLPVTNVFEQESNSRQINLMKKALLKAIDSELTERQRQMVTAYYFEGKTVTEIAKDHGLSKSTVSRHLSRARERLKGALKYGWFTLWNND